MKNNPPEREDHVRITKKLQGKSSTKQSYIYALIRGIVYWGVLLLITLLVGIVLSIQGYAEVSAFAQLIQLLLCAVFFLFAGVVHTKESSIALRKLFGRVTKTRTDINPLSHAEVKSAEFLIAAIFMFVTSTLFGFIA